MPRHVGGDSGIDVTPKLHRYEESTAVAILLDWRLHVKNRVVGQVVVNNLLRVALEYFRKCCAVHGVVVSDELCRNVNDHSAPVKIADVVRD